jgi:hypothetical protein
MSKNLRRWRREHVLEVRRVEQEIRTDPEPKAVIVQGPVRGGVSVVANQAYMLTAGDAGLYEWAMTELHKRGIK